MHESLKLHGGGGYSGYFKFFTMQTIQLEMENNGIFFFILRT